MRTQPIVLTPEQAAAHVNPARIVSGHHEGVPFLCAECHTKLRSHAAAEAHDCMLDCGLYELPGPCTVCGSPLFHADDETCPYYLEG